MEQRQFVGYHPEKRRSGSAVKITRGPEVINPVKTVLYGLSALGVAAFMVWGYSEIQRRFNEGAISDWTTSMVAKLRDPLHNLTAGEKFYPEVQVVPAGRTSFESSLMEGPVNIRNFPSLDPERAKVIGRIPLGGTIRRALLTGAESDDQWVVFRCLDAQGDKLSVTWTDGNQPPPGSLCVMSADHALNAASK